MTTNIVKRLRGQVARPSSHPNVEHGSGNVFADLGFPHPDVELVKASLTLHICRIIKRRRLTQARVGKLLGIKQPNVLCLMRGSFGNQSVYRLMKFLAALGQDVDVIIKPTRAKYGAFSVLADSPRR